MSEVFLNTGPDGTPVQLSEFVPGQLFSSALQTGSLQASTVSADQATITSAILQSGIVTGSPLEPGSASIASTRYVDDRIASVIGASPAALDSLQELAAALGNDSNFAATITTQLASKASLAGSNVLAGNVFVGTVVIDSQDVGARFSALETRTTDAEAALALHEGRLDAAETDVDALQAATAATSATVANQGTRLTAIEAGTFVFPSLQVTALTTASIVDNGNLLVRGNIQLGDSAADSLTVFAPPTFREGSVFQKGLTVAGNFSALGGVVLGDASVDNITVGGTVSTAGDVSLAAGKRLSAPLMSLAGADLGNRLTGLDTAIAARALDSGVVHLAGSETIGGEKSFDLPPKVGLVPVATTADLSVAINALVGSAPGTLDTLSEIATALQADQGAIDSIVGAMATKTGVQTLSSKTLDGTCVAPTQPAGTDTTQLATTAFVQAAVGPVQAAVASKAEASAVVDLESNQTVAGVKTFSSVPVLGASPAASQAYVTTAIAAVPVGAQVSAANSWAQLQTFANVSDGRRGSRYTPVTLSGSTAPVNYAAAGSNLLVITAAASAMTLSVSNVPTNAQSSYELGILIDASSNKQCVTTLNINGSAVTLRRAGGALAVNASAVWALQSIVVIMNNATPLVAISSVASLW